MDLALKHHPKTAPVHAAAQPGRGHKDLGREGVHLDSSALVVTPPIVLMSSTSTPASCPIKRCPSSCASVNRRPARADVLRDDAEPGRPAMRLLDLDVPCTRGVARL